MGVPGLKNVPHPPPLLVACGAGMLIDQCVKGRLVAAELEGMVTSGVNSTGIGLKIEEC